MANFLNRLAGRALGAMPLAEPVIPARFSPSTVWLGRTADYDAMVEGDDSSRDEVAFRPAEIEPRTHATRMRRGPALRDAEDEDELDVAGPDVPDRVARAAKNAAWHEQQGAESSASASPTASLRQVTAYPAVPRPAMPRRESASAESLADPVLREARDQDGIFTDRPRSEVPGATPTMVQDAYHRAAPDLGAPSVAPTIRVTIGRIDVRAEAASPPAATGARRTRASALSLEQYLKQRSEGGR
jgi:hypothetical protein